MKLTHLLSLTVLGLSLTLAACKPGGGNSNDGGSVDPVPEDELSETSAQVVCELIFGCSCENPGHADETACVDSERSERDDAQLAAQAAGLTYDAQCAGQQLAQAEASGCAAELAFDCSTFCAAYHGDVNVAEPCTAPVANQATWSDCAQGLLCLAGSCQDPCGITGEHLGPGDACRDDVGESLGDCDLEPGLWCDSATSTCIVLPGVGEPCYGSEICGPGAVCDWSGSEPLCVDIPGAGEACDFFCDEGLYCDGVDGVDGMCVTLPGAGQPCASQGACAEGLYCDETVCAALPAWICEQ